jgi:hypothetical protein
LNTTCIICNATEHRETVEHIIPGSLGNEYYVLPRGVVCFNCNNRIARVEHRVVSSMLFMQERKRYKLIRDPDNHSLTELNNDDLIYLVVKMGYEGLYKSKRKIWNNQAWKDVKEYLIHRDNYPGIKDRILPEGLRYNSIPGWMDRFRLRNHHLTLEYGQYDSKLYVRFQFGKIRIWTRLI